ncbi:MAG: class I SAM-dependent methyltransferase [Magnetococcales bacterium]|nr:class I SAM-dependent methyltransferase [Magnetococcales bacterium]
MRLTRMFRIGREQKHNPEFPWYFRLFFGLFGAPEIGAKIRVSLVLEAIQDLSFSRLLDGSCGRGYLSFWLARQHPHASIRGVDLNPERVAHNRATLKNLNLSNLTFDHADLTHTLPGDDLYDAIITVDTLEHIDNDVAALKRMREAMTDDGRLIILVPADASRHYHFFQKAADYVVPDHVRPGYSVEELQDKLEKAGFILVKSRYLYGYFELYATQIGMVFSNRIVVYALLLPMMVLTACIPERWAPKVITNSLLAIARPHLITSEHHEPTS